MPDSRNDFLNMIIGYLVIVEKTKPYDFKARLPVSQTKDR